MAAATVAKNLKVRRQTKALEEIFKKVNLTFLLGKTSKDLFLRFFFHGPFLTHFFIIYLVYFVLIPKSLVT